jgi:predicted CopG family antitoxin
LALARTISVADDVFEWLKEEKGERSYSEVLREFRDIGSFSDVNGANSLSEGAEEEIDEAVEEAEEKTEKKIRERF